MFRVSPNQFYTIAFVFVRNTLDETTDGKIEEEKCFRAQLFCRRRLLRHHLRIHHWKRTISMTKQHTQCTEYMLINNDAIIATLPNGNCNLQLIVHGTLEMSTIIIAMSIQQSHRHTRTCTPCITFTVHCCKRVCQRNGNNEPPF